MIAPIRRAIFAWFIFTCAPRGPLALCAAHINSHNAPARADGMLCYKLLGDEAQSSFARSWGISYGVGAAAEWKDIVTEAVKGALLLAILERLFLTRPASWVESNVDYLSTQARRDC